MERIRGSAVSGGRGVNQGSAKPPQMLPYVMLASERDYERTIGAYREEATAVTHSCPIGEMNPFAHA